MYIAENVRIYQAGSSVSGIEDKNESVNLHDLGRSSWAPHWSVHLPKPVPLPLVIVWPHIHPSSSCFWISTSSLLDGHCGRYQTKNPWNGKLQHLGLRQIPVNHHSFAHPTMNHCQNHSHLSLDDRRSHLFIYLLLPFILALRIIFGIFSYRISHLFLFSLCWTFSSPF